MTERKNPNPLDKLTPEETAIVQVMLKRDGAKATAKALGLFSEVTVYKAVLGLALHAYSVRTVREHLQTL